MFSILLKKALPFTLTFILGAILGGLFKPHSAAARMWTWHENASPELGREDPFGNLHGHDRCRMRRRYLVAETKSLSINFKPDARWPRWVDAGKGLHPAWVVVTFGADGKVQQVEPRDAWPLASRSPEEAAVWVNLEHAARQIQFTPETVNSIPVPVTKEIEIHFMGE